MYDFRKTLGEGRAATNREPQPAPASVQPGGRAAVQRELVPIRESTGRATTYPGGMAPLEPGRTRLPPETEGTASRVGVGRGATRGREQREIVFTRPSKEFVKTGKSHPRIIHTIV